ncbi:MAG: TonB-dependent receptor, partial [Candidatus Krumholzibacteria bacterium]|nr:TonB-dependent receptor [Candidatus Krumholzibacteria bacterium]
TNLNWSGSDPYVHNWNQEGYVNRIHIFERLEPSGEVIDEETVYFHVIRGSTAAYHGPWYDDFYLRNKELQKQGLPNAFEKILVAYKPAGIDEKVLEICDAMRVKSAWSGAEFLVLTEELFDGFYDGLSQWSYVQDDSSQVYYNSAEHTTSSDNFTNSEKFIAIHNLSDDVFYKLALTRLDFKRHSGVGDKLPGEYLSGGQPAVLHNGSTDQRVTGLSWYTDPDNPFLATAYDYPSYFDRHVKSYILKFDLTSNRWRGHKFKTGLLAQYNDMDSESVSFPGVTRTLTDSFTGRVLGRAQGLSANVFHNYAPLASFYAQDRWEFQGLVANFGVRYDLFSPGNGVEILLRAAGVDPNIERYKHALSPRLGLAFPITDRDKFHFHYGRFIQAPANNYLFQTQDPNAGTDVLGNPDLKPEITVSYQAGISHQFTANVTGDFALFYKDIYSLITTSSIQDTVTGDISYRYINKAYASARGMELTLSRRFADNYGGQIAYTFSYADGVASDALFGTSAAGLTHLPTRELPLNWDQRHSLDVSLQIQDPGNWGGSLTYSFGSGFPWTPAFRFVRRQDPELENSRRLPATHSVTLTAQKFFNIWGQDLSVFFDGRNLLDQDMVGSISPGIWPGPRYCSPAYTQYLTETGNFGGAYLADMDGDGDDEYYPVHDPRVYYSHRTFRIGFGLEF